MTCNIIIYYITICYIITCYIYYIIIYYITIYDIIVAMLIIEYISLYKKSKLRSKSFDKESRNTIYIYN
jgi:hypothetical protein